MNWNCINVLPYGELVEVEVLADVVELFVMVEAGVLILVVIWLVVPIELGCSVVVVGIEVVAPVEVMCTTLVVGTNPETSMNQNGK